MCGSECVCEESVKPGLKSLKKCVFLTFASDKHPIYFTREKGAGNIPRTRNPPGLPPAPTRIHGAKYITPRKKS